MLEFDPKHQLLGGFRFKGTNKAMKEITSIFLEFRKFGYIRIASYLVLSLVWLVFANFVGQLVLQHQLWFALFATFLLGLPLYLGATYAVTVNRIHRSSQFRNLGTLYWLLSRRVLAYIWWLLWSVTFSFLLLFYLGVANTLEWVIFFIAIPVFAMVYAFFLPIARREYKPYIAVHKSLVWTRWFTAIVMAILYILLIIFVGENHQYDSLSDAVQVANQRINSTSNSVLILETARVVSFFVGLKSYVLGNLYILNGTVYLAFVFLGSLMIFFNIALALSSFMVPMTEYRRVLGPLQDTEQPPRVSPRVLAITSAFITFFLFFIYVPSTVYIDGWLRSNPQAVERLHTTQKLALDTVELIGDDYYEPGTIKQIEQAYIASISELEIAIDELKAASDYSFQHMADNVDDYLDWYYSLPAEYERIVALATGALEEWMAEKLQDHLMKGNAFGSVQQKIETALQKNEQLRTEHLKRIDLILAENQIQPITAQLDIINNSSLDALKEPPSHSVIVNIENRMLISGGVGTAGAVTGAIAGKVTAKVAAKGAIKFGAQALIKVTAGKAASLLGGAAAGAASGAAIGSVVPGAGTAVGAAIGGIIGGLTVGLTVEKLLLMLEETYSRDDFKQQILEAIADEKAEFEKTLSSSTY